MLLSPLQPIATLRHRMRIHDFTWTDGSVIAVGCDESKMVLWSPNGE
jgi:hypothetical protein